MIRYLLGLIIIFTSSYSLADEPPLPPTPYKIELESGNKVFVMIPHGGKFEDFTQSGLYHYVDVYDSSINPWKQIYSFSQYLYQGEFYISNDGRYIVDIPWWIFTKAEFKPTSPALTFYKDGGKVRSIEVSNLMSLKKGLQSVSHIQWDFQKDRIFDSDKNILTIQTRSGKSISFDITTGQIIK
ncbi:MAG: hypothetical protein LBQ34_03240 [Alphaproteobacteria bacterium]|jgi:hypothetical protein|nr:hypothetical protein [Alphaproteobacteria bacterium]